MATTASGLVYPTLADDVDPPDDIKKLADSVEPFVSVPLVRLILPANQSIPTGVDTAVAFGASSEIVDTHGFHSTTTNTSRITPSRAGWYRCTGNPAWTANTTGQRVHFFGKNGAGRAPALRWHFALVNQTTVLPSVTALISCNGTSDYIEFFVNQASGGALNLLGNGNEADTFNTIVEVEYVRPL